MPAAVLACSVEFRQLGSPANRSEEKVNVFPLFPNITASYVITLGDIVKS